MKVQICTCTNGLVRYGFLMLVSPTFKVSLEGRERWLWVVYVLCYAFAVPKKLILSLLVN